MVGIPSHFWRLRHRHGAPTFCDLGKLNVVTKVEIDHDGRPTVKNCHTTQFFPHFFPKKIGDVIAMDPWWSLAARSRPAKSFSQPTEKHDLNQRPTTPEVGPSKFGRNMPKSRQWQSNLPIENCSTYHFQFFFGKNVDLLLSGKTARMRNGLQSFFKPRGPRMYTHGFHVQMFAAVTLSSRFVRVSSLCRGMQLLRTPPWGFKRSFKCPTFGFPVASQSSKLAVIVAATTLSEKKHVHALTVGACWRFYCSVLLHWFCFLARQWNTRTLHLASITSLIPSWTPCKNSRIKFVLHLHHRSLHVPNKSYVQSSHAPPFLQLSVAQLKVNLKMKLLVPPPCHDHLFRFLILPHFHCQCCPHGRLDCHADEPIACIRLIP